MKIGLVLSGGGARCLAQIGVLRALEQHQIEVAAIAANSSAAILGALYAACPDADRLYDTVKNIDYASFLDPGGGGGLIGHAGVKELLQAHVPATFEELSIPLAVPTVDIQSGEQLIFNSGPLVLPVCASNALPGLFVPVEYDGHFLMDGGILDNFPVDIIRSMTQVPVIAVDTTLSPSRQLELEHKPNLWERLTAPLSKGAPLTVDILMKAYNITQSRLIELVCAMHPPDYTIRPALGDDIKIQDFGRLDEAVDLGYQAAMQTIAEHNLRP